MRARGTVLGARGGLLEVSLPGARIGDGVSVCGARGVLHGTVGALLGSRATVAPHGGLEGVTTGDAVHADPAAAMLPLGTTLLGRAFDARGHALDGGAPPTGRVVRIGGERISPAERRPIAEPLWTGVRVIDALLTIGRGARIGLFGEAGVGKSLLLQALARGTNADAVVVGLVGERGREAQAWTGACDPHASVVCATGDRPAAERVWAARVAMSQAHALRARGLHVLAILDSLARFGAALREIAVASGESVGRGGYPPSVFAELAGLVEIAGCTARGSITLIATVLSDGDERDPLSDAARSLLDGHVQLAPRLARAGHYPAVDVPASISRTMDAVVSAEHLAHARAVRRALALLAQSEDARSLGIAPADPATQAAVSAEEELETLLRQGPEPSSCAQTLARLARVADTL